MITKDEILQGRDKTFPQDYTTQISDNIDFLLDLVNIVRTEYGKPMYVASGFRPASMNAMVKGAAPKSNHIIGLAVDFKDPKGELKEWVLNNLELMQDLGLFIEDFRWTKNWVHMQAVKPGSGKRIFIPAKGLPPHPEQFDGNYDSRFNEKPVK